MSTAENVTGVMARIRRAAERAARPPEDIILIAVSKTFPTDAIQEALTAGVRHVGENRVQEAAPKIEALARGPLWPTWHLVGHLQTNKVKTAVRCFDIIHSVDSLRLAEAISRHTDRNIPILLEVNVSGEPTKFGLSPGEVSRVADAAARLPRLDVAGLMTVAPRVPNPEDVRPVFRRLREIRDALGLRELSMGMTEDFEVAIEEGATMVRVGRAIFGDRPPVYGGEG